MSANVRTMETTMATLNLTTSFVTVIVWMR